MKKNVLFLIPGLLLIFHSIYALGNLTKPNLPVDNLSLILTIVELLSGGYLFYMYKKSKIKKNTIVPQPSRNGHVNLFGLIFGTFVFCNGVHLLYLKLHHKSVNIASAIFLLLFGLSLLLFTYFQYKRTS
jgi:cbb3-type cytochrome oxidase subunit 3